MSFELIYTSAPRGIKAGTRGYCTVAFTEGMPANYVQLAESLSGYQKPENMAVSPVAYSHYRFVVGGQRLSVLSRVTTAAYADYTGRRPTIAHHVLVEHTSAQPDGSPAGVMADPAMFLTEWHDEPRLIRKAKNLPSPPAASFAAKQWEQACGDAGWAGVLAQSAQETTLKPVYMIFNPERLDPLPLLAESLNLLPPDMRWTITFNTFFTSLPHDTTCLWRCCLPGSPALREMRATPGALCIDLTKPSGRAPGNGPLVESARTGEAPSWTQRSAKAFVPPPSASVASASTSRVRTINAPRQRKRAGVKPSARIPRPGAGRIPAPAGRKEKKIWPIIVASVSVTAVIMLGLGLAFFLMPKFRQPQTSRTEPSGKEQPVAVPDDHTISKQPQPIPAPTVITEAVSKTSKPEPEPVSVKTPEPAPDPKPVIPEEPKAAPPAPPAKPPADMTPEWQSSIISAFNQLPLEVPVKDPICTNHQHVFYFKTGTYSPDPKNPSVLSKQDIVIVYEIPPMHLNVKVSASELAFSGTTNSTDYPVSMRIKRENSGKGEMIIWLQTLKPDCTFTSVYSEYIIFASHPALTDCLFGQSWPTNNQPWKEKCRISFTNSTNELKEISFSITQAGGRSNTWNISLTLSQRQIEDMKESMRDEKKTKSELSEEKYTNDPMEHVRQVVKECQESIINKSDVSGKNNIAKCLESLAEKILEEKESKLKNEIKQFSGDESKTIQDLINDISKEFLKKVKKPQVDLNNMISILEDETIPEAQEKKQKAEKARDKKAPRVPKIKDDENIADAQKEIEKWEDFKTRIIKLRDLTELQDSYDLMDKRLETGYSKFFNLILNDKDQGKFKAFGPKDFEKIKGSVEFKNLIRQRLPHEPDPENMLMIVDIYSKKKPEDVLLSLIQKDEKRDVVEQW